MSYRIKENRYENKTAIDWSAACHSNLDSHYHVSFATDGGGVMFGNGLEKEIIIKLMSREYEIEGPFGESRTRIAEFDRLLVWANKGLKDAFEKVPGIVYVTVDRDVPVRYVMSVDPRYDVKWVMAEVEAAAKLQKSEPPVENTACRQTMFIYTIDANILQEFLRDDSEYDSGFPPHF